MAGTRLASHTFFLIFSLVSVLVAWRLGVVKRAALPLENMADPFNQNPPQPVFGASSAGAVASSSSSSGGGPLPPAVDIDVVLLRSPKDGDCPSCAAALDALQTNPSLARHAFRAAEEKEAARATAEHAAAAAAAATTKNSRLEQQQGGDAAAQATGAAGKPSATAVLTTAIPLLTVREVNLRVVHTAEPPLLASSTDDGGPTALDDWLRRHLISPPRQQQQLNRVAKPGGTTTDGSSTGTGTRSADNIPSSSSPRYTFFVACAGAGDAGELPTFIMGKRRHGYLGLGCACPSCAADSDSSGGGGGSEAVSADSEPTGAGEERGGGVGVDGGSSSKGESPVAPPDGASSASSALQALSGIIVAHVLRSPVRAGDVHVRRGQAYRLNFSLLNEDPALRRCMWDFARASRRYLRPLLRKLSPVASFAVQSQEVQYAFLSMTPPRYFSPGKRYFYSPKDLQGFLGANDFSTLDLAAGWGADTAGNGGDGGSSSSNSSKKATGNSNTTTPPSSKTSVSSPHSQVPVNFMMFCPSPRTQPLVFMEDWAGAGGRNRPFTEAYEVPGFGGVSVVNEEVRPGDGDGDSDGRAAVDDILEPDRLRRAFGAHVSQLRRIIGLPRPSDRPSEGPWPSGGQNNSSSVSVLPLTFLPSPADGVTDWEVDALLRAGMARNREAAAETLRSLAALVESQPEMEVSSKVAGDVAAALAALANTDAAISEAATTTIAAARIPQAPDSAASAAASAGGFPAGMEEPAAFSSFGRRAMGGDEDGKQQQQHEWAGAEAMRWAREALRRSEEAYLDPTMVPQLYFPQDHLMAVYFPFLAPLAFPLIFGFAQELVRYYRKTKKTKNKAKQQ